VRLRGGTGMYRARKLRFVLNCGRKTLLCRMGLTEGMPWRVLLNITLSCNMRCKQCDSWKMKTDESQMPENQLTDDEWNTVVPKLKRWLGSFQLTFSGGEPLLKKDTVIGIIKSASDNGISRT
jgi:MoaA/NifB/PqqE/SkfB family radical SAM enzyme